VRRPRRVALGAGALFLLAGTLADAADPVQRLDTRASAEKSAVRVDPPRSFTVIAGGDVLTESRVRAAAAAAGAASGRRFDFHPMFAPLRPVIESADLAICNMEIPIGQAGAAYGYFGRSPFGGNLLLAPYEVAPALRTVGFDRCSTASNHGYDLGAPGIAATIEALRGNGISTVGTARSPAEAVSPPFSVNGVRVAHLAYTTYTNTVAPSESWRLNYTRNPNVIAQAVRRARGAGAEVVMVSVHISKELLLGPTPADRAFVTSLTAAADVDAVFVHGPHVVQPFEVVNRTPVWWSLGNFVSEMGPPSVGRYASPRTSDGLLAVIDFVEATSGEFLPFASSVAICNDLVDRTVRSATLSLRSAKLPARVRTELQQCLSRTRGVVPSAG
jgi:poly-gamma-glutamate synthesis protein (capsule biosynthesis protein)